MMRKLKLTKYSELPNRNWMIKISKDIKNPGLILSTLS